jgi:Rieske Fe-S protein
MVLTSSANDVEGSAMSHRRTVLAAAGICSTALLAGCVADSPPVLPPAARPKTPPGEILGSARDIPVSGGKIYKDRAVVVTQPSPGEYRAFSATCTHMGCIVAAVQDNIISCKCHNAKYSATDGAVEGGPATKPLPALAIRVDGDTIELLRP